MKARLPTILMGATSLCLAGRPLAGPLSTQPLIGFAAEYASNPSLASVNGRSEAHEALLADIPVDYDLDRIHFAVTPSVRYSDATGYSSVTSNYYRLDAKAELVDEFDVLSVSGAYHRDSSLLYAGEVANGLGVRRDTSTIDANWRRTLTERLQLQLDASTMRTLYDEDTPLAELTDYRYSSASPVVLYQLDERSDLRLLGGVGRYYSLNHLTSSENKSVQLGYDRRLTEIWTLSATAGYSKSLNAYAYYLFGFFYLGTIESDENGAVFSATLTRQTERITWTATVSRSQTPTGLAFLSKQDSVSTQWNFTPTERWTLGAGAIWSDNTSPPIGGGSTERRFYDIDLSAVWHLTEQWQVSARATRISQRFAAGTPESVVDPISNGISLEIARQFHRTNQ